MDSFFSLPVVFWSMQMQLMLAIFTNVFKVKLNCEEKNRFDIINFFLKATLFVKFIWCQELVKTFNYWKNKSFHDRLRENRGFRLRRAVFVIENVPEQSERSL